MEDESRSPETESIECAGGSPEASSTRPNPFIKGDAETSRKRRRTSLNVDSQSRPVGSNSQSPHDSPIGETIDLSSSPRNEDESSVIIMDAAPAPSSPHTPENKPVGTVDSGAAPTVPPGFEGIVQQPTGPSPHVTLSLRNSARRTLDTIPSSPPASPTPSGRPVGNNPDTIQSSGGLPDNGIMAPVGDQVTSGTPAVPIDVDGNPPPYEEAMLFRDSSPHIEVINLASDDENGDFGPNSPDVTLLSGDPNILPNAPVPDPTTDFPYMANFDNVNTMMAALSGSLTQNPIVPQQLYEWIENYLLFARTTPFEQVLESYTRSRWLWVSFSDMVWSTESLRVPGFGTADLETQMKVRSFCGSFARLAAFFVQFDVQLLETRMPDGQLPRDNISCYYHMAVLNMIRRDTSLKDEDRLGLAYGVDERSAIIEQFVSFHDLERGGTLGLLHRLMELLVLNMPAHPKIIEQLTQALSVTAVVTRESYRNVARDAPAAMAAEKDRLDTGKKIFDLAAGAFETAISNHINSVSPTDASSYIGALSDLFYINLKVNEQDAIDFGTTINERHPIPLEYIPDALAMKWRVSILFRLIKTNQMALRLMAVTDLSHELVACYKRYGEQAQEHLQEKSVLQFVADILDRTGVVSYMLGPTCHPEITAESSNIVGFLAITRAYTNAHTDLFWQTVMNTQDPRISEALIRNLCRIVNIFGFGDAVYFCKGFLSVPMASFTAPMRELCESFLRHVCSKAPQESPVDSIIPFDVCLRMLRESSVWSATGAVAYPVVQAFANTKLRECLQWVPIDLNQRQSLYQSCLEDLQEKSQTALGSLCAINIIDKHYGSRDLAFLTEESGLSKLVVDELEGALDNGRNLTSPAVISGPVNAPRRDIISSILIKYPYTLTPELSSRLWEMMAGPAAACIEDRNAFWNIFLDRMRAFQPLDDNPFLAKCLTEFLPRLSPDCFCEALLDFLFLRLEPLLKDLSCSLFDNALAADQQIKDVADENKGADHIALEQLWRIALTTPPNTIESLATHFLVKDVYIESRCIQAFPLYRSRRIHLALVDRCLNQLSSAAENIKWMAQGEAKTSIDAGVEATPGNADRPALSAYEQELLFVRSLKILLEFLHLYRDTSHFSSPDLGPLISGSPMRVVGESAELKYQSFDGDIQTEIKPLDIGRQNTAASLLAALKEATGFDNYRIYYRGKAFAPRGKDIRRSLEELHIQNGLILVKCGGAQEEDAAEAFTGGPPVESRILDHFQELWGYLSMKENLSSEIHNLLVELNVDQDFLRRFDSDGLVYTDVFYIGQPYKSLFTLHALDKYLSLHDQKAVEAPAAVSSSGKSDDTETQMQTPDSTDIQPREPAPEAPMSKDGEAEDNAPVELASPVKPAPSYQLALSVAINLTAAALCDPRATKESANPVLQVELNFKLLKTLGRALDYAQHNELNLQSLDAKLLNRLMDMLSPEFHVQLQDSGRLVLLTFEILMNACALSREFWNAFREHENTTALIKRLILQDDLLEIRQLVETEIGDKIEPRRGRFAVNFSEFREFFWPVLMGIVPDATLEPTKSEGIFNLVYKLFSDLVEAKFPLDISTLLRTTGDLLLSCTTSEDVTQPELADYAMFGLTRLFDAIYCASQNEDLVDILPFDFMDKLFWKHLFPPWKTIAADADEAAVATLPYPRIVISSQTRALLAKVIFNLVDDNANLMPTIIRNLNKLVPCEESDDDDEPYHYELPANFDRTKALRASCAYSGLRNLSNTCYLNSLFTQLFMNVPFRQFMMQVDIRDEGGAQSSIFQARVLFGFMQDSLRRYVDTEQCVASIKTYDETPIDINIQMDVDEFYNLLFDRWEGQFSSEEDKKTFRSFFGGQIVQQVRSKECEHVSERLEPFSAIQCDVKGKTNLQESLRAYVEGEIMEGDNKYNCSSCDRHVDAIKRACLKDIPDSLIFHLKRFDFNLRNLTRSKINDYFSFPKELDMRPYTIDQLSDPSEEQPADMFELVGILIHSGTAETGHYYSYIRERPSSQESEHWVEFNDEAVRPWDPNEMEEKCFGCPRPGNHYNVGVNDTQLSDKTYSAYMLFYQRSSSLAQEKEALLRSGIPGPAKAEIPLDLSKHIRNENTSLVRRHALYDPQHLPFVSKMLGHVQFARPGGECSADHRLENLAIEMALSHLDQVASRTKDIPDFSTLFHGIAALGRKCAFCSLAIFDYFENRPEVLKQMVQRNLEPDVRHHVGRLILASLRIVKEAFPNSYTSCDDESDMDADADDENGGIPRNRLTELSRSSSLLHGAAYMMHTLFEGFHLVTRTWHEVFGFMLEFANMGREEVCVFLDMEGFKRALLTISVDTNFPLDLQFQRLANILQRRARPPSYENVIALLRTLLATMYPIRPEPRADNEMFVNDNTNRFRLGLETPDGDIPMNSTEFMIISWEWEREGSNVFVDKLICIDQNPQATDAIIARLMFTHPEMEKKVFKTLKANITSSTPCANQVPFLRAAAMFIRKTRSHELSTHLTAHICRQCRCIEHNQGRAFLEVLCDLFNGRTSAEETDMTALVKGLRVLPIWVPGLLCYYDPYVSRRAEEFVHEAIFVHGTNPQFDEEEGGQERAEMLTITAKKLGVELLKYIHVAYYQTSTPITSTVLNAVQRVVAECTPYYSQQNDGESDQWTTEFSRLSSSIPDMIRNLVVDDIEEDGSDWNSSRSSVVDSLGDTSMQTAGESNDADQP